MSLPKPNLDNRTFEQLVEEARKLVPGYSPEWNDYNPSDPGITLIDLLAWLSEIALYRTNLITDRHRLKYLQLLGIKPQTPKQAKVDLTFSSDVEMSLPKGTQVTTKVDGKEIYFQLDEDINIVPGTFLCDNLELKSTNKEEENESLKKPENTTLKKIVVDDIKSGIYDRSVSNEKGDLFFAPFGEDIQKDCSFYLGFEFKNNEAPDSLNFMCYLYEEDMIEPGKHGVEKDYKFENACLKWEISVKQKSLFQQIHDAAYKWEGKQILLEDKTEGFKKSGRIIFKGLEDWVRCNPFPELTTSSASYFWLRCRVEESHYEYPPRIEMLRLNTVSAIHSRIIIDDNKEKVNHEFKKRESNGLPGQVFKLRETPILDKTLKLSIKDEKWKEIDSFEGSKPFDKCFVLDKEKWVIKLGDGKNGLIPSVGFTIRIIIVDKGKLKGYEEWVSNGLPNQIFKLLKLFINGEEWIEVANFEKSGPLDKHFILDNKNKEIKLGDGKKGLVPSVDSEVMIKSPINESEAKRDSTPREEWIITGLKNRIVKSTVPSLSKMTLILEDKWSEVDSFEVSKPSDKHFVLDHEKGELKFGDGIMGTVPSDGSEIEILEYVSGGGEEGNLMPGCSWNIEDYKNKIDYKVKIINCKASTGGKRAKNIEEAIEETIDYFCRDLKTPYTAVTLKDFEHIAKNTPGLRVAKAKAIPNQSSGSVTVVVIPYTPLDFLKTPPEPSEGFKHAVCQHLNEHRLVGTDIHVISPKYVKVTISATIVPMDSFLDDNSISEKVHEKLKSFLHPITGGSEEKGWPIGRDVYLSELHDLIENIEGVNCVIRLSISGDQGASTDSDGNLKLNSIAGVVYSGVHRVEILRDLDQYYKRGDSYSGS